jgi:hypothetical protein
VSGSIYLSLSLSLSHSLSLSLYLSLSLSLTLSLSLSLNVKGGEEVIDDVGLSAADDDTAAWVASRVDNTLLGTKSKE